MFSYIFLSSCWAFSAVSSLEFQYFKKYGKQVLFSEQNLVDCIYDKRGGCNGAPIQQAFNYIKSSGGINTQDSYPVKSQIHYFH